MPQTLIGNRTEQGMARVARVNFPLRKYVWRPFVSGKAADPVSPRVDGGRKWSLTRNREMLSPNNDRVVYVTDPHGLHLRPCSAIVKRGGEISSGGDREEGPPSGPGRQHPRPALVGRHSGHATRRLTHRNDLRKARRPVPRSSVWSGVIRAAPVVFSTFAIRLTKVPAVPDVDFANGA